MATTNALVTRRSTLESFQTSLIKYRSLLSEARTPEELEQYVNELMDIIEKTDIQKPYDVIGTINAFRMHDRIRNDVVAALNNLIIGLDSRIKAEIAKENATKLRKFFEACAEHAEEIAQLIGQV